METSINKTKKELINWIENLDDPDLLSKLLEIKEITKRYLWFLSMQPIMK